MLHLLYIFVRKNNLLNYKLMKHFILISIFLFIFIGTIISQETNIVFIGNSITQATPPAKTIDWLRKNGKGSFEFSNCGVSGTTTTDFLPISEKEFPKVKEAADKFYKEGGQLLFSIMLGTNDSAISGPVGAPLLPQLFYNNMKTIVGELLNLYPEAIVVLNRAIWYSPNTYNKSMYLKEGLNRLESYYPMLEKIVSDYETSHPKQVFMGDTDAFEYFKDNIGLYVPEDGNAGTFYLHPNEKGAKVLAEFWGNAIVKALENR